MFISDMSDPAARRRRIIQQPLRTEAPVALIVSDASSVSELEARLKRNRPLITFPSLSHFLADPPRREAWAAIVVARASAWDVRLDTYVRRRRSLALFGLPEEGYGWPEEIARVRDTTEIDAWLEQLNAPDPVIAKRIVKRQPRTQTKPVASTESPSWMKQGARVWEALASPSALTVPVPAPEPLAGAPETSTSASAASPQQLELAISTPRSVRRSTPAPSPERLRAAKSTAAKREARPPVAKAAAPVAPAAKARQAPKPGQPEQPNTELALLYARSILREALPSDPRGELAFTRAAAELGLVRAAELLADLTLRAAQLARSVSSER
jgi:hypothetical protein